jgi:hypothetical protein
VTAVNARPPLPSVPPCWLLMPGTRAAEDIARHRSWMPCRSRATTNSPVRFARRARLLCISRRTRSDTEDCSRLSSGRTSRLKRVIVPPLHGQDRSTSNDGN